MGQCATRITAPRPHKQEQWRNEVLKSPADAEDYNANNYLSESAKFAPLKEWKEVYEPPGKGRGMPNFIRRRLRQKVHDMLHWTICCMVLDISSNVLAQLEAQLLYTESMATEAPAVRSRTGCDVGAL